jgi:hypothetical protein
MNKPQKKTNDDNINTIDVDAGTLLLVVSAIILLPLLLTGFFSH